MRFDKFHGFENMCFDSDGILPGSPGLYAGGVFIGVDLPLGPSGENSALFNEQSENYHILLREVPSPKLSIPKP
jgi:hypothetical protein